MHNMFSQSLMWEFKKRMLQLIMHVNKMNEMTDNKIRLINLIIEN